VTCERRLLAEDLREIAHTVETRLYTGEEVADAQTSEAELVSERLRAENAELQRQLNVMTYERDALGSSLDELNEHDLRMTHERDIARAACDTAERALKIMQAERDTVQREWSKALEQCDKARDETKTLREHLEYHCDMSARKSDALSNRNDQIDELTVERDGLRGERDGFKDAWRTTQEARADAERAWSEYAGARERIDELMAERDAFVTRLMEWGSGFAR
jgi:chromosome segregation ATPase